MAYGRRSEDGGYVNSGDEALAAQIMQQTREREQRNWTERQMELQRRQQVKADNAAAFDEAGRTPRESGPAFLATGDGRTGYIEDGAFIPSQVDALADRNRQLMEGYRMQGVQTRAAQKERENLQNVALCGMIQSAQQNGGFVDPSMLGMVNQQLGDGTVKCIGGDTDGRGNLRIYGETGNGQRGVMLTLSRQQQAALMGKTPGVEGGQAFVEKYLTDQIANGVSYEDAMRELGLDPGKMKSGASAAMRGERAASGGRASAQEKFDKEWFGHLMEQVDALDGEMASEGFASKTKEEQDAVKARRQRYADMIEAYENNFAARYPTADERVRQAAEQAQRVVDENKAREDELRQIDGIMAQRRFDAAFQNGSLAGSGSWRGADGEEVLRYNGRRYAVGDAVDLGNGTKVTWLGGGIGPKNFELVAEAETSAPEGYGLRNDGKTYKGTGWLGELPIYKDGKQVGVATEYTMQSNAVKDKNGNQIDFPTLVPTLTKEEVELMVRDIIPNQKPVPEEIAQKAVDHALSQLRKGESVFANDGKGGEEPPKKNPRRKPAPGEPRFGDEADYGGTNEESDYEREYPPNERRRKSEPTVTEEAVVETPKGEAAVAVQEPAREAEEDEDRGFFGKFKGKLGMLG